MYGCEYVYIHIHTHLTLKDNNYNDNLHFVKHNSLTVNLKALYILYSILNNKYNSTKHTVIHRENINIVAQFYRTGALDILNIRNCAVNVQFKLSLKKKTFTGL